MWLLSLVRLRSLPDWARVLTISHLSLPPTRHLPGARSRTGLGSRTGTVLDLIPAPPWRFKLLVWSLGQTGHIPDWQRSPGGWRVSLSWRRNNLGRLGTEGPEGPMPQNLGTPELQRHFVEIIKMLHHFNDLEEETVACSADCSSAIESLWGPQKKPKAPFVLP